MTTKITIFLLTLLPLYFAAAPSTHAQSDVRQAVKRAKAQRKAEEAAAAAEGGLMRYIIEDGDTVYVDDINPVTVRSRRMRSDKDWARYYRLVYNFAKVYPYALLAARLDTEVDSTIEAGGFSKRRRDKYVNSMQDQVLKDFKPVARKMTIKQGTLLLKLIDREAQKSSYDIIRSYKSRVAAGFWQGVAKMFDNDLKTRYDPEGEDSDVEELVKMWEGGRFEDLYYSIFLKMPPEPSIPEKYR